MKREDIIRMAREAGLEKYHLPDSMMEYEFDRCIERFAALVATAKDAEHAQKSRYDIHSCGPDCQRYVCVAVRKAREEEREIWLKTASVIAESKR